MKKIELLCPAGDLERLKTAVAFGADAVYCGLPDWSLRNPREITFTLKTLKEGIEFAHKNGAKVYVTFNVFAHEGQLKKVKEDLKRIKDLKIDGLIVSDLGMLSLIKKYLPKASIHISTQANTLNSETVKMWQKLGARRVVLARELTFREISEIKKKNPGIKLEVFGHGAMCIAYSGRCLLSKYFTGREANLGDCAQSCRWKYKIKIKNEKLKMKNNGVASPRYFIEEETRSGDLLEIQEDPNGTYIMNSKDLCALGVIDKFIEAGIDSLKIEGRAKTVYYLAVVTRVYRKAIDLYYAGKLTKRAAGELLRELTLVSHRGYSHGFWFGENTYEQEYEIAAFKPPIIFLGVVLGSKNSMVKVEVKNKFKVGEEIEIVTPNEVYKTNILEIKDEKNKSLDEILKPEERVWAKFGLKETHPKRAFEIPERSVLRRRTK